jgi:hypothetical protein
LISRPNPTEITPRSKRCIRGLFWSEATDPRPHLFRALGASLRPEGSILVYSKGCEENVVKELGRDYPEFKAFAGQIIPRLVDLYEVFLGFMMYDPRQLGKTRFKKVLECFAGKSYEGLAIKNGETATYEYQRVTHQPIGPVSNEDRDAVYRHLEQYCDQDSWGQHDLVDVILQLSGARIAASGISGLAHICTKTPRQVHQAVETPHAPLF